jgi:hypothetical protein
MHSLSPLFHNFIAVVQLTLIVTLCLYDYLGLLSPIELKRVKNDPITGEISHWKSSYNQASEGNL